MRDWIVLHHQFTCWSPNLQYITMWPDLEIELILTDQTMIKSLTWCKLLLNLSFPTPQQYIYKWNSYHLDVNKIQVSSIGIYELQLKSGWTGNETVTFRAVWHMTGRRSSVCTLYVSDVLIPKTYSCSPSRCQKVFKLVLQIH